MDRHEAIVGLLSLPCVTRISVADLKANDVLVLECERGMSQEAAARIKEYLERLLPEHKAIVLTDALRLRIVSGDDEALRRGACPPLDRGVTES